MIVNISLLASLCVFVCKCRFPEAGASSIAALNVLRLTARYNRELVCPSSSLRSTPGVRVNEQQGEVRERDELASHVIVPTWARKIASELPKSSGAASYCRSQVM
jgi:hypothetical protein